MPLTCPRCAAKATLKQAHTMNDKSSCVRYYACIKGHRFQTREVPLSCVNGKLYAAYRKQIVDRQRAEKRRLYVMRHPDMHVKLVAMRMHMSVARVAQLRAELAGTHGYSRLSPPRGKEDE